RMARLGVSKKKKSPRVTALSQLKKEVQRLTEQLESRDRELEQRSGELREALGQQTATSEILRVIASSPIHLHPVLDNLIANAVKLSGATMGHVRQFDGEFHRVVAHYGETPEMISALRDNPVPPGPATPAGQALSEGKTIQILDVQSDPRVQFDLAR